MKKLDTDAIEDLFSYHPPEGPTQIAQYQAIRDGAKAFAKIIVANTPQSADQTVAIRKLRESVMTANASIALKGMFALLLAVLLAGCSSAGYYARPETQSLNAYVQTVVLYSEDGACYLRIVYKDNAQSRVKMAGDVCENARTAIAIETTIRSAAPPPPPPKG